jgi:hypothetical protein
MSSTIGYEKGMFLHHADGSLLMVDRVMPFKLVAHRPSRWEVFWWRLVNKIKYRWRSMVYNSYSGMKLK